MFTKQYCIKVCHVLILNNRLSILKHLITIKSLKDLQFKLKSLTLTFNEIRFVDSEVNHHIKII